MTKTADMPFTVEPLSPTLPFGSIIRGLRREHLASDAVREKLRHYWISDGLVLFDAPGASEDFHVELSEIFGPLELHPLKEVRNDRRPEINDIVAKPGDNTIVEVDGERGANWIGWHSDLAYVEGINHGGILRALKPTSQGGLTGFVDQIVAYDTLSDTLKERIEGLSVVYGLGPFGQYQYGYQGELKIHQVAGLWQKIWDTSDQFPKVIHPIVFVQPETGRKVLHISPFFALYIEGMQTAEGDALLRQLCDHIGNSPSYHHKWSTNELVLWDNWRMLHRVSPIPPDQERVMQRTTIAGDYGLGRVLQPELAG